MYGAEVWGAKEEEAIERVQERMIKRVLQLERSTPAYIVLQESNRMKVVWTAGIKLARYEEKISKMEEGRIIKEVFKVIGEEENGRVHETSWGDELVCQCKKWKD